MSALFISLLTLVLILISVFVVFLVLMQKSQSGGMGSALGGGMAESAFGSETSNVLTKATIFTSIAFFIIALVLYLLYQNSASDSDLGLDAESIAPIIESSASDPVKEEIDGSIVEIDMTPSGNTSTPTDKTDSESSQAE
ncbi:MAG: preprotein translocase subunit SecG [Puniceicoccaceae bacterium]|nr:preprotein translocase subunit SecG [Puniceicoccaceae bacterium]RCL30966.1 MAG: preprotein translocase subunit SecG [Puniceicoccaceae bacterium]